MTDLKPCPFCNSIDVMLETQYYMRYFGHCKNCGCDGPMVIGEVEAAQAWNKRPETERLEVIARGTIEANGNLIAKIAILQKRLSDIEQARAALALSGPLCESAEAAAARRVLYSEEGKP